MKRYVVYEIWTSARMIEAKDMEDALEIGHPRSRTDLNLCNWHVYSVDGPLVDETTDVLRMTLAEKE